MRQHHVEIYQDRKKEWRWRAKASNGKVLADSGEGFKRRGRCVENLNAVAFAVSGARVLPDGTKLAPLFAAGG